ncbi:MAG: hypothetical protein ACRDTG_18910 [Pseudonocardiaceae bacterium]
MGTGHHSPRGLDLSYVRISTAEQSLERRLDSLATAGIGSDRICCAKWTGTLVDNYLLKGIV